MISSPAFWSELNKCSQSLENIKQHDNKRINSETLYRTKLIVFLIDILNNLSFPRQRIHSCITLT
jgi:hypothetical protein